MPSRTTAVKVAIAKAISTKATVSVTIRIITVRIIAVGIVAVGIISVVWIGIVKERISKAVKEEKPIVEVAVMKPISVKSTPVKPAAVEAAPTSDTADPFRHGYGADALAFHFNHAGVLSAPPAYIVQATPNEFYTSRLGSLVPGHATSRDVEAIFGRPQNVERRSDGLVTYYAIEVYNPFEDLGGRR